MFRKTPPRGILLLFPKKVIKELSSEMFFEKATGNYLSGLRGNSGGFLKFT